MGLRIFGGAVAALLAAYAVLRYRKGQLRRGEMLLIALAVGGLGIAAAAPGLLNPVLEGLGFHPGEERRIIGLLVISNVFTLALVFLGFSRDDQLSTEVGDLVDYMALQRFSADGGVAARGACVAVMPAYNEADNLPDVLAHMPDEVAGLPVVPIVIADGCTDATEATARNHGAAVIRRDLRRGSGAAVRLGYQAALAAGAKVIVTIDADGQHDPREMERLVTPLMTGGADMVQGSRVMGHFEVESSIRKHGVSAFARLLTWLGRTKITDPSTGYRAITAEALRKLDLRQDQFYVSEVILDAARKGFSVVEVPITLRRRANGATKKPKPLKYAWGFSKAIVRTWFR
ncbi:MAG TPA: glycosyltransferase family 2 protein [Actinomycetota bacterium]|nr:glycosyltransferase family 2 protein [Actinomycetota bacterium]